LMGMPITVEIDDIKATSNLIDEVFDYFDYVDKKFSTYKEKSEINQINRKEIKEENYSQEMKTILALCETTKKQTDGFFDIEYKGKLDPSGLVKGWAIYNAAQIIKDKGFNNYYVEAGGDIEARGKEWRVGIRNPFNLEQIVKVIKIKDMGVATSGTYMRGQHIYNPKKAGELITDVVSLTVIGPNIFEADRMATAAFAMGKKGIYFIESLPEMEGYMINSRGVATMTTRFKQYEIN